LAIGVAEIADESESVRKLRSETTTTLKWIAGRLKMGKWIHVSNLLKTMRNDETQFQFSVNSED
jgi:hypothetical protein